MADWSPAVVPYAHAKAHAAPAPGGHLLACRAAARDQNPALAVVWEQPAICPYDDFGASVYKLTATYEQLSPRRASASSSTIRVRTPFTASPWPLVDAK